LIIASNAHGFVSGMLLIVVGCDVRGCCLPSLRSFTRSVT